MSREIAIETATARFDLGEFIAELARLVAIPTESQRPEGASALKAYLEEAICPMLEALGCSCRIIPNPAPGGGPFLIAERREGEGLPTVLTYGHGECGTRHGGALARGAFALGTGGGGREALRARGGG